MKVGSLIKYYSLDNEVSYGIITEYFKQHECVHEEPSVRVHWLGNNNTTLEIVRNLLDPNVEFISIVNEAR